MNIEIDGVDLVAAAEVAGLVGAVIALLVVGLVFYLLVRPPRHVRAARSRPTELQDDEAEQLLGLMDRMEARLGVLERALADRSGPAPERPEQVLESADDGRQSRRMK